MSNNIAQEVTTNFIVTKTRFEDAVKAVQISDHESFGPFVRISESSGENYIYITAFFLQAIEKENISVSIYHSTKNTYDVIVELAPIETGLLTRNKWAIILKPKKANPFKNIESVNIQVNFNESLSNQLNLNEPTRGTKVIPPKGSSET